MKRDSYSDQHSRASFQPRSSQSAIEPSQFGQPLPHSSSTSNLGSNWLNKASSWVANKFQAAQDFVNGSGDAIAPEQILPALGGTAAANQPIVGVIDTGFGTNDHGSQVASAIAQTDHQTPEWLGTGVKTGRWAESLTKFVDVTKSSGRRAIANLSFDLTETHPDGTVITRQQLTDSEQTALKYAYDNGVLIVASAGNQGGEMSALGQAAQQFDNIIAVGASDRNHRAAYSSDGQGLGLVAPGSFQDSALQGTSLSAAEVTGATAQVWAANSKLSDRQVIQTLESTAKDLDKPGWDAETGFGQLNPSAAVDLAQKTQPETYTFSGAQLIQQPVWKSVGGAIASARPDRFIDDKPSVSQAAPLSPKEHDERVPHTVAAVKPNPAKSHLSISHAKSLSPEDRDEGATHTGATVKPNPAKPHLSASLAARLSPEGRNEGATHTVAVKPNPAKSHPSVSHAKSLSPEDRDEGATHTGATVKPNSAKPHLSASLAARLSPEDRDARLAQQQSQATDRVQTQKRATNDAALRREEHHDAPLAQREQSKPQPQTSSWEFPKWNFPKEGKSWTLYEREFPSPYVDGDSSVELGKTELKALLPIAPSVIKEPTIWPSYVSFTSLKTIEPIPFPFATANGAKITTTIGSASAGFYGGPGEIGMEFQGTLASKSLDLSGASGNRVSIGAGLGFGGNGAIYTGGDTDNDGYSEYGGALGWKLPLGISVDVRLEPKYLLDKAVDEVPKAVDEVSKAVDNLKKVFEGNIFEGSTW